MGKKQALDGFDKCLADYKHSTHHYEDHDANLESVLRLWPELSAEGKLGYIARDAAIYGVPFERFAQAAREAIGGHPLPSGEQAYLRLHLEYQRALWGPDLPAFPREHPLPANDPHRDALAAIDDVLAVKFYRLLDDYEKSKQPLPDADGQARTWPELSAAGKIQHLARIAAIFDVPFSHFAHTAREAIEGQTLHANEDACLRLCYQYAQQIHGHDPQPLPLAPNAGRHETAPSQHPWLAGSIDPMLTELESFGDEFERLARTGEQRKLAAHFKDWIHHTSRTLFTLNANTLATKLFSTATPQQQPQSEHTHERQHKR